MPVLAALPSLSAQAERLLDLGVAALAGLDRDRLRAAAANDVPGALLVVRPALAPASALAPLLNRGDKPGFVVEDMTDVDLFAPIAGTEIPEGEAYLVVAPDRGDAMANWSPDEALPAITAASRTPLLLTEGIGWLLQQLTRSSGTAAS